MREVSNNRSALSRGPLISVIITSYTLARLKDIKELLDSLQIQKYPFLEVIFVVENSLRLYEEAIEYTQIKSMTNVIVIFNSDEPGASAARNLGIKHACGDIIAFLDDCTIASPEWAEEIMKTYLEDESIIGVAGAAEPVWEEPSMAWFPRELYWLVSCTGWLGWQKKRKTNQGATVNVSYKRDAFARAGLFSNELGPKRSFYGRIPRWHEGSEDIELSLRIRKLSGAQLVFNPAARVGRKVYKYQISPNFIAQRARATGWSRHMVDFLFGPKFTSRKEFHNGLLIRIITRLLPDILGRFFRNPIIGYRQFLVTVVTLCFVILGYISFFIHNPFSNSRPPMVEGYYTSS